MKRNSIWIHEHMKAPMNRESEGKFIFTGPCAVFDQGENENFRNYDVDDYLRQLEYINSEIPKGLLGELNHNEKYEIDMERATHIIRKVWYDEKKKTVFITIELLDEGLGKLVKNMVEKGFPLYISSRASGFIDDNGNVELERIYTFDIVYRPGFKQAVLEKVYESANYHLGITTRRNESLQNLNETQINNKKPNMDQLAELQKKYDKLSADFVRFKNANRMTINEAAVTKATDLMAQKINKISADIENMKKVYEGRGKERMNSKIINESYITRIAKSVNESIDEFEAFKKHYNESIPNINESFTEIKRMKRRMKMYESEMIKMVDHMNRLSEIINENLEEITESNNSIIDEVQGVIRHNNNVTKMINENFMELDADRKGLIKHTNRIAKSVNESIDVIKSIKGNKETPGDRVKNAVTRINENRDEKNSKQEMFLNTISQKYRSVYESANAIDKKRIVNMVNSKSLIGKQAEAAIDNVISDSEVNFALASRPKSLDKVWESLDQSAKSEVLNVFRHYKTKDSDTAVAIWESLNLTETKSISINENLSMDKDLVATEDNDLGYQITEI